MIGIFDSGEGGRNALHEIRKRAPWIDVCYLADRKNAPYGTKSRDELVELVSRDVERLLSFGVSGVLMACCTASTVHPLLEKRLRDAAIPIIAPTVREAADITKNGKVGVIATAATVNSGAFREGLLASGVKDVIEIKAQPLVGIVEKNLLHSPDRENVARIIRDTLYPIKTSGVDTLILGCTHFCRLKNIISGVLPGVKMISSSKAGAIEVLKNAPCRGRGQTVYME